MSSIRRNNDTIIQTLPDSVILKWGTHRTYDMFSGRDFVDMVKLKNSLLCTHYRYIRMFPSINTNYLSTDGHIAYGGNISFVV